MTFWKKNKITKERERERTNQTQNVIIFVTVQIIMMGVSQ